MHRERECHCFPLPLASNGMEFSSKRSGNCNNGVREKGQLGYPHLGEEEYMDNVEEGDVLG